MNPVDVQALVQQQIDSMGALSSSVQNLLTALSLDAVSKRWIPCSSHAPVKQIHVLRRPVFFRLALAYNTNTGTTDYLQVYNRAFEPIEGAPVDVPPVQIGPLQTDSIDMGETGVLFDQGLYICGSSTDLTKTKILTNDLVFFALYRPAN
jgi:hypothetical protein